MMIRKTVFRVNGRYTGFVKCHACSENKKQNSRNFEFFPNKNSFDRVCFPCRLKGNKPPPIVQLTEEERHRKRLSKYNLSDEKFIELMQRCGSKCEICFVPFDKRIKPNIDHCHSTGKVRGILCTSCNTSLGRLKDSIKTLHSAIIYLQSNQ
jgi:hypothetical protein